MAEDTKKQAEELLRLLQDQTSEQAEQVLQYRNLTEEIVESISKVKKRTEAEKALLGLSRKLQETARESNKYLAESGKLEQSMTKILQQQLKTEIEIQAQRSILTARERKAAETSFNLQKKIETLEIEGLKRRENLSNLTSEERRKELSALKRLEAEKEHWADKLAYQQRFLGATDKELKKLRTMDREYIEQKKRIEKLSQQRKAEPNRRVKSQLGHQLEQEKKTLKEIETRYAEMLAGQPRIGEEGQKQVQHMVALLGIQGGFRDVYQTRKETLQIEEQIRKTLGLTGIGVKALGGIFKAIGVNSSVVSDSLSKAEKKMREVAESGSKWETFLAGASTLLGGIQKHLSDPLVILTGMVKILDKLNKDITSFQRSLGLSREAARGINQELIQQARNTDDVYINSDKLRKSFISISEQLGFNIAVMGGEILTTFTHLTENLGMSVEHATSLATLMRMNGKNTEVQMKNLDKTVQSFSKQSKIGMNIKQVYSDIASFSKAVLLNIGKSPKEAALLSMTLRKVKMEMGDLESIMSNLVEFESSIQNEIEARLLTGDRIELSRARELALMNDYRGVAEEVTRQEAVRQAFINKNRIAQQSVAKAIGVSVEKLGEMYYQQELLRLGAPGFKDVYGDLTYQSTKALDTSQKFKEMIEKVKLSFQALLLPLEPIVNLAGILAEKFSWFATHPVGKWVVGAAAGWFVFGKAIKGTLHWITNILPKLGMKGLGGLFTKGMKKTMQDLGEGLKEMAGEKVKQGAESLKSAAGGFSGMVIGRRGIKALETVDGKAIKKALAGLAEGLEEMSQDEVESGSKNLLRASFSFIAMIPGYLGAKLISKLDGKLLKKALVGIGSGLTEMSPKTVRSGSLNLGLFAVSGALATASLPFLWGISALGPKIATGLTSLATGLAALGNPATIKFVALGAAVLTGAMLGLGAAVWMVGKGLGAVAPLVDAIGNTIYKAFSGISKIITSAAEGFETVITSIKTIKLEDISNILSMAKALQTLTQSVIALKQAGPVSLALQTTGIETSEKKNTVAPGTSQSTERLVQKIDELISILKTKGNVYLDGNKVGEALRMGTYRQGLSR